MMEYHDEDWTELDWQYDLEDDEFYMIYDVEMDRSDVMVYCRGRFDGEGESFDLVDVGELDYFIQLYRWPDRPSRFNH